MADMSQELHEQLGSRFLSEFHAQTTEAAYRDYLFDAKRNLIRFGLVLATLLFLVIEPLARYWVPSEVHTADNMARWFIHLPLVLVSLAVFQFSRNYALIERVFLGTLGAILLSNAYLLWVAGSSDRLFYGIASVQIMVFGFLLLGLRFKPAFLCILFTLGLPAGLSVLFEFASPSHNVLESIHVALVLIFCGMAFAAYSLDIASRTIYLMIQSRDREYAERLELESERIKWLSVANDFLNHELKNALLGITFSLDLIKRRNKDSALNEYIARADSSTLFVRRVLREVSASTSLESALEKVELERIDLKELLEIKVADYQDMYPSSIFELSAVNEVFIACDVERIVQVLDKLIANAVEHSAPPYPIDISLAATKGAATVTVSDVGDALIDSELDIFDPFVSRKTRASDSGFGFGLFVVKRIVEAHGGSVSAERLSSPDGARFTVTLPL